MNLHRPNDTNAYTETDTTWTGRIGVQECIDICTRSCRFWVKLDNDKASLVSNIRITVNPFPCAGMPYLADYEVDNHTADNLRTYAEFRAYAEAMFNAGKWAGEWLSTTKGTAKA